MYYKQKIKLADVVVRTAIEAYPVPVALVRTCPKAGVTYSKESTRMIEWRLTAKEIIKLDYKEYILLDHTRGDCY